MKLAIRKRQTLRLFEGPFPKPNNPYFYERTRRELETLRERKPRGSNSTATWLQMYLIKKKGERCENLAFYLWLFLCIRRPWSIDIKHKWETLEELSLSKDWFTKKEPKNPSLKKVNNVLRCVPGCPNPPDHRTLNKYYNKPELENVLIWIVYGPREVLRLENTINLIKERARISEFSEFLPRYNRSDLAKALKLRDYIVKQGQVLKSGLYYKFRYSKAYCDKLLRIIQESDYIQEHYKGSIQVNNFPQNRVIINYTKSKNT